MRSDEISGMGYAPLYLPLRASMRIRGVLAVRFADHSAEPSDDTISLLETLASLIAVAVERLHYVEVAQATEVRMLTERLRSSILAALSHDLRTPLTALVGQAEVLATSTPLTDDQRAAARNISHEARELSMLVGLADSLFLIKPALPTTALETAQALHEQAARLAGLVANLLDMARLNAGEVTLRREWQPLEEVVGASIKLLGSALAEHRIKVELPRDLPLLHFDAVLIERVFCNLLENAAKYAPSGSAIELAARQDGDTVSFTLPKGIPPVVEEELP